MRKEFETLEEAKAFSETVCGFVVAEPVAKAKEENRAPLYFVDYANRGTKKEGLELETT